MLLRVQSEFQGPKWIPHARMTRISLTLRVRRPLVIRLYNTYSPPRQAATIVSAHYALKAAQASFSSAASGLSTSLFVSNLCLNDVSVL